MVITEVFATALSLFINTIKPWWSFCTLMAAHMQLKDTYTTNNTSGEYHFQIMKRATTPTTRTWLSQFSQSKNNGLVHCCTCSWSLRQKENHNRQTDIALLSSWHAEEIDHENDRCIWNMWKFVVTKSSIYRWLIDKRILHPPDRDDESKYHWKSVAPTHHLHPHYLCRSPLKPFPSN